MEVLKFGGTSVANATAISRVLDIVDAARSRGKVVLVCSAVSGCTDALIALSEMDPSGREKAGKAILDRHNCIVNRLFTGKERKDVSQIVLETYKDLIDADPEDYQTFGSCSPPASSLRSCAATESAPSGSIRATSSG
jgi:aspartokinase